MQAATFSSSLAGTKVAVRPASARAQRALVAPITALFSKAKTTKQVAKPVRGVGGFRAGPPASLQPQMHHTLPRILPETTSPRAGARVVWCKRPCVGPHPRMGG